MKIFSLGLNFLIRSKGRITPPVMGVGGVGDEACVCGLSPLSATSLGVLTSWEMKDGADYREFLPPPVVIAVVLITKAFGYIGKKNKAGVVKVGKRTLWEEFLYGFYVMMHPFDGFWDLKHEKRGSVRGALCIVALTILSIVYQNVGSAYLFGNQGGRVDVFGPVITVVLVLALWCIANWCLTTLFDGEGNLKDIFIATSYALVPIPLITFPATLATNICSLSEAEFVTLALGIAYVWTGMLIFFGSMTTHGYSMGRNIAICFFTIIGMVFIMFMAVLFWNLITRMVSFVSDIITEISYRAD